MRVSAATSRDILLRIGADESDLARSVEVSKKYIEELQKTVQTGSSKVVVSSQKVGKEFQMAFGGRPRFAALSFLSSQLSGLTYNMVGVSGGARALTGAFMFMQSGAMALGAALPVVLGATVALTGALAVTKLTTHESSKTFENYRKKIKEVKEEQEKFNDEIKKYNDLIQPTAVSNTDIFSGKIEKTADLFKEFFTSAKLGADSLFYFNVAMSDAHSAFGKMTDEQTKLFSVMDPLLTARKREIELLKIEGRLIRNENIPNLQNLVNWYKEEIKYIRELSPEKIGEIDRLKKINELTKERIDAEKKLKEALKEWAAPYIYKAPKMKDVSDYVFPVGARKLEEMQKKYKEDVDAFKKAQGEKEAALARLQNAWMSVANQIASAFQITAEGIEFRWQEMINNLMTQLAQSGLSALIVHLFHPEWSFAKLFKGAMGFQYGTPYVPRTGLYPLHKGEAVIPASQNISNVRNYGGATNNYYLISLDVENLTRKSIVPTIEKLARDRKTRILTA